MTFDFDCLKSLIELYRLYPMQRLWVDEFDPALRHSLWLLVSYFYFCIIFAHEIQEHVSKIKIYICFFCNRHLINYLIHDVELYMNRWFMPLHRLQHPQRFGFQDKNYLEQAWKEFLREIPYGHKLSGSNCI